MKLFGWVQNKLINGIQGSSKLNICPHNGNKSVKLGAEKEEFSDWPQGFLSIGTLGSKDLKEDVKERTNHQSKNPMKDLTLDEVKELEKKLSALISSNDRVNLDCLSSLEGDHNIHSLSSYGETHDIQEGHDQHCTSSTIVPNNKANDVYLDNKNGDNSAIIRKKSLSFLLKKMFVCGGGLGPTPSLRDPILLSPPRTRMEKILRAILQKKIYPQSQCQSMTRKKYLKSKNAASAHDDNDNDNDDDDDDEDSDSDEGSEGSEGSKWVKTDTEYIVLEI